MARCYDNPAPDGQHEFVAVNGGPERCVHCDQTWADTVRGFGSNGTQYEMPSRQARLKRKARAKFGNRLAADDE